jgi:hypothetical protein
VLGLVCGRYSWSSREIFVDVFSRGEVYFDGPVMGYVMITGANGDERCHGQIQAAKKYLADGG